jgi:methionyl-tRNA formyltransferase
MALRLVFMGTPDFAVPCLSEIVGRGHDVIAVYTQPPRPAGRGMAERRSPVHEKAAAFALPVLTPKSLKDPAGRNAFAALDADAAVVVAYGLILPQATLDAPRLGCFNLHASLLPRWRGAAPIQRAVMAGDKETGVMVMRMEAGLDTGPVCMAEKLAIGANDTAGDVHERLAVLGADLMVRALAALERGTLDCVPQSADGVTHAAKIDKAEARIDFTAEAAQVHNLIRGLSPFPGAWCNMVIGGKAERVKVLRSAVTGQSGVPGALLDDNLTVACGKGAVCLLDLQRAGKKPMRAQAFLNGLQGAPEIRL